MTSEIVSRSSVAITPFFVETRSIILDKQIESSCASQGLARLVPCPWELGWVSRKFDGISCVGLDSHDAKLSLALRSGSRGHGLTEALDAA